MTNKIRNQFSKCMSNNARGKPLGGISKRYNLMGSSEINIPQNAYCDLDIFEHHAVFLYQGNYRISIV
jgi:hypothetical protein